MSNPAGHFDPATIRSSYEADQLTENALAATWLDQLKRWYATAASDSRIGDPNAMQVATVDEAGRPDIRTVLARVFDSGGLVFYTNYDSAKGRQLAAHPFAAAQFSWLPLQRQVRLRGPVSRVTRAETEAYFASRPRGAQLAAWASPQSQVVAARDVLEQRVAELESQYEGKDVPAPDHWGGYRIEATEVEFWQGRQFRLHDRLRYRKDGGAWVIERLAP